MRTLLFITVCLYIVGNTFGQNARIKRADAYYDNLAYVQASEDYRHVADKTKDPYSIRRLAECYVKLNETEKAEVYYRELINGSYYTAEDLLACSKVMRSNNHFEDAQQCLARYCALKPNDEFARQYMEGAKKLMEAEKAPENRFELSTFGGNSTYSDFGTAWYGDQVLFVSSRNMPSFAKRTSAWDEQPFLDIFVSGPNASSPVMFEGKLNTKYHEGPLTVHPNGEIIYFTRNNYLNNHSGTSENKTQKLKIYQARMVAGEFSQISDLPFNNDEYSTGHPSISTDGKWLFFASDMPGGYGGTDIYKIALDASGAINGSPINLGTTVNSPENELFPFIHNSGLLFYSSNGWPGYGGMDIFVSQSNLAGDYVRRENIGRGANSEQDDFSFILNAEQTEGYLSSNRTETMGNDDIWHFNLLRPFGNYYTVKGYVTDKRTKEVIPYADISLYRNSEDLMRRVEADETGYYEFDIDRDSMYGILGEMEHYFNNHVRFTAKFEEGVFEMRQDIALVKNPFVFMYGIVTDKNSGKQLDSVHITILDKVKGDTSLYVTDTSGDFRKTLPDRLIDDYISFHFKLERRGYLARTVDFAKVIEREGMIRVDQELDFTLEEVAVGVDLGKVIDLNTIYFDYNKYNIRPDAAIELDKIVKALNDNPEMMIELGSHTDSRGSGKYNQSLSQKRAKSSAEYIKKRITNPERIYSRGYGESVLLNDCGDGKPCSEADHQLNRRTEFRIVKM